YNGKTSWLDYLVHFEMIAEINRWDQDEMALELATSLRDSALSVLSDIDVYDQRNYDVLVRALTTRFEPPNYAEVYKAELKSKVRQKGESLCVLVQDIKRLIRKIYVGDPRQTRDKLATEAFIDALGDMDMEWEVSKNKPFNIDVALQYAMEYEAFRTARSKRMGKHVIRLTSTEEDGEPTMQRDSGDQQPASYPRRQSTFRIPTGSTCNYCKKPGHWKKECRKRIRNEALKEE
ncbi:MAG: hypothetical protein GY702_13395, partial [Desulfobulbaceae bacterium]|nr:hypothetical protein [Desulfobulbaceae bacterium]